MTHSLTVTPSASKAYVLQSLCYKKSAGLMPFLILIRVTYLQLASSLVLKCPICHERPAGQARASLRPGRSGLRPSGMATLLVKMKNAPNFFPSASECSEESSLISPPRLGVPFRIRSAQRLVVLTFAHKKSCSEAAFKVFWFC